MWYLVGLMGWGQVGRAAAKANNHTIDCRGYVFEIENVWSHFQGT